MEKEMHQLRDIRKSAGVSLDELAAALGPGFSRGRLSACERGLAQLNPEDSARVLVAIERLGRLRQQVRKVVRAATEIDPALLCTDLRAK